MVKIWIFEDKKKLSSLQYRHRKSVFFFTFFRMINATTSVRAQSFSVMSSFQLFLSSSYLFFSSIEFMLTLTTVTFLEMKNYEWTTNERSNRKIIFLLNSKRQELQPSSLHDVFIRLDAVDSKVVFPFRRFFFVSCYRVMYAVAAISWHLTMLFSQNYQFHSHSRCCISYVWSVNGKGNRMCRISLKMHSIKCHEQGNVWKFILYWLRVIKVITETCSWHRFFFYFFPKHGPVLVHTHTIYVNRLCTSSTPLFLIT